MSIWQVIITGIEDLGLFHCCIQKYMWLSVIQTQQRERVGMCFCLCMPVCTYLAHYAWLHAQVCVYLCVSKWLCVKCFLLPPHVYNMELTAGTAEIFTFFPPCIQISMETVKLNSSSWYNCQQIPVTKGYGVTMDTPLCITNLCKPLLRYAPFSPVFSKLNIH